MPKQISSMTKDRLKEAVHDMAIITDEGTHPTAALVKVAKSLGLTEDQTRLVGRAFNTAKTADVRTGGTSILEKLATTAIADCEDAVAQLSQTKTASASSIAGIYMTDKPVGILKGLSEKVAHDLAKQELFKAAKPELEKPETSLKKMMSDYQYLDLQVSKLAGHAESCKEQLNASLQVLQLYSSKSSPEERMATKLAAVRSIGKKILTYIDDALPTPERSTKVAQANPHLLDLVDDVYRSGVRVKQAIDTLKTVVECRQKIAAAIKKKLKVDNQEVENPVVDKAAASDLVNTLLLSANLKRLSPDASGEREPDIGVKSRYVRHGILTPEHRRRIERIRIKSLMNDVMANDDIIGGYDQDDVFRAFNELQRTAPDAMSRPMIARSYLREALAKGGTLGSYDINPLMSYDKDTASQRVSTMKALESDEPGKPSNKSDKT